MTSLQTVMLKTLLRLHVKRSRLSGPRLVAHLRARMNLPVPSPLPRGIRARPARVGGVDGVWLTPRAPALTLLYLHGGAFIGGRLATYHHFCGLLARRLNARLFLADYRLAPEHPYPAASDDCLAVYRALLAECQAGGQALVVAGDSAGGNLTLGTLLRARDEGLPMPACAIALSPGVDATASLPSLAANSDADAMLSRAMIEAAIALYVGDADPTHPYVSPGRGDFRGLPPLLVTVSEDECLRDDAYCVLARGRAAAVPVELLARPDMPHVWPIFTQFLPEARADLSRLVHFVQRHHAGWLAEQGGNDPRPHAAVSAVAR
jgi:acetyl esterase/lipase